MIWGTPENPRVGSSIDSSDSGCRATNHGLRRCFRARWLRFWDRALSSLAGEELTLKLIRAKSPGADLGSKLFNRAVHIEWDARDIEVLRKIAAAILTNESTYSGSVASAAAGYLFVNNPVIVPPLQKSEQQLGLHS